MTAETKNPAPGPDQFLVTKGMSFAEVKKADEEGKKLVFDLLDFPEIPLAKLGQLSTQARMAYQMDYRIHGTEKRRKDEGWDTFHDRVKILDDSDPLSRRSESLRVGKAKSLPKGMKHLNVGVHEVDELERAGWRKAKPDEVDIVGAQEKAGAVVLTNPKGGVENVTMLVDAEKYEEHRKAERAKTGARLEANISQTKEKMRQYAPKVTIYDKTELQKT